MRPEVLFPLFAPVTGLPGVGPRYGKLIEKLAGPDVVSLCWHLPSGLVDRRHAPKVADAPDGAVVTLTVTIDTHQPPGRSRRPYKVIAHDETGFVALVYFNYRADYLERALPPGAVRVVSGRVERFGSELQMAHPDYVVAPSEIDSLKRVEPVYPLTAGLPPKVLGRAIEAALGRAPDLPEWIDPAFLRHQGWPRWREALLQAHAPQTAADLDPDTPARRRLAFDELLASQLALALIRAHLRRLGGRSIVGTGRLQARARAALPFALTRSQEQALEEIRADMAAPAPMLRLLQGDVGSGKTVVAFLAMLTAVEAGAQAALLAPTDILARQHFATMEPLAAAAGVELVLFTGRDKGKGRAAVLAGLESGRTPLAVGTHALLQEQVAFRDLALAVIDEQHRFGVHQRLGLAAKGRATDVLVMTATPIPRTLALTAYGDMDVSRLIEKPPGRRPVDTRAVPLDRLDEVVEGVARAVGRGARAFWVCPLVDESETVDLAAAVERHAALRQRFGERVGLVHGRMAAAERDATMAAFAAG
ncbi:MAG: ATP-dependent DNA helicase RecG, partial [Rhodospirillaceae bacterium]|nr:ATP-dependent DNA helicase RecG [Rhodospirillaceae bacterium]